MQKLGEIPTPDRPASETPHRVVYWLLIFFLVLEYVRPPAIVQFQLQFVIILILAFAFLVAKDRPWSGILTAQLLFFVVVIKSLPFALNNYAVYQETRSMFGYIVIALALAWLMSWQGSFRQLAWTWVIILGYTAIYAIGHGGGGPGNAWDENDMALAACVTLPFALFGFDNFRGWRRWTSLGLAVVFVAAIVASFSRGGFIGLVAVSLYYFFSSRSKVRKLLILAVAVSAFLAFAPDKYLDEIRTIPKEARMEGGQDSTATSRLFVWTIALEMWKANPIMGIGAGNYAFQAHLYQPTTGNWPSHYFERGWSGTATHSVYFQLLSELGIPGVALFAYIVWAHFTRLRSLRREARAHESLPPNLRRDIELYGAALAGGMIGYLACGVFLSMLYYPHFWYLSGMAVALDTAFRRQVAQFKHQNDVANKAGHTRSARYKSTKENRDVFRLTKT